MVRLGSSEMSNGGFWKCQPPRDTGYSFVKPSLDHCIALSTFGPSEFVSGVPKIDCIEVKQQFFEVINGRGSTLPAP